MGIKLNDKELEHVIQNQSADGKLSNNYFAFV